MEQTTGESDEHYSARLKSGGGECGQVTACLRDVDRLLLGVHLDTKGRETPTSISN